MDTNHAAKIIDALSPTVLMDELGMTERNIRHFRTSGTFGGIWYRALKDVCERHGIHCPLDAFNWRSSAKNDGMSRDNNSQENQTLKGIGLP